MKQNKQRETLPHKLLAPIDILFLAQCFLEKSKQAYENKDEKYFNFHYQLYSVSINHYSKMTSH